jgi:hypothetical protein
MFLPEPKKRLKQIKEKGEPQFDNSARQFLHHRSFT